MAFNITLASNIVIYGAGKLGQNRAEELKSAGYNIVAFMDKNAEVFGGIMNIPVYTPQNEFLQKLDVIIIVCVHNGLWHIEIASLLHKLGYDKILFIPLNSEFNFQVKEQMQLAYSNFDYQEYDKLVDIPQYSELIYSNPNVNSAIIYQNNRVVVTWISVNLIYTSCGVETASQTGAPKELEEYANVPIPGMKPYVQLFKYISGVGGDYKLFLKLLKKFQNTFDDYTDEEFIGDRVELYKEFQKQLNFGMTQFINAAPECRWNARGFFNLCDGMTRTTFLYSKGFQYVPVKMSKEDFEHWCNFVEFEEIKNYLHDIQHKIRYRIEHPGFMGIPIEYETTNISEVSLLQEYFGKKKMEKKSFLEYSPFGGEIARYFSRMGAQVVVCADKQEDVDFLDKVFKLCHIQNYQIERMQEVLACKCVDIAYVVHNDFIDKSECINTLHMLNDNVREMLIWENVESALEEDIKNITRVTEFKLTHRLTTIVDIKSRGIVIFEK